MCETENADHNRRDGAHHRDRALVSMAPLAMVEITLDGRVSWVNARWVDLIATTTNRALGQYWFDWIHADDLKRVMEAWRSATSRRARIQIECRIVVPDRPYRWIEIHAAPLLDASTGITTYALTAMDVTEKHHLKEMARTTRDLETWAEQSAATLAQQDRDLGVFAALVASSADAIAIVDPDERVRYTNGAFHDFFELVFDISWCDLLTTLGVDENVERALLSARSTGEPWQSIVTLERPRLGTLHADIGVFSIMDATARKIGLAIVIRDLSAHKEVEIERAKLHAEIIAAQESAIRELSTPLLPIGPGILAMPLVGNIDTTRGRQILDTLLSGIHEHHAAVAILDVTGVRQINADVAHILLRSAQAAQLLGTNVILTGIGPFVAKALVQLGTDLTRMNTLATFEQGIRAAFATTRSHKLHDRRNNHPLTTSADPNSI